MAATGRPYSLVPRQLQLGLHAVDSHRRVGDYGFEPVPIVQGLKQVSRRASAHPLTPTMTSADSKSRCCSWAALAAPAPGDRMTTRRPSATLERPSVRLRVSIWVAPSSIRRVFP